MSHPADHSLTKSAHAERSRLCNKDFLRVRKDNADIMLDTVNRF